MKFIIPALLALLLGAAPVGGQGLGTSAPGQPQEGLAAKPSEHALGPLPTSATGNIDQAPGYSTAMAASCASLREQAQAAYVRRDNVDSLLRAIDLFHQAYVLEPDNQLLAMEYCMAILWLEGYHFRGANNDALIQQGMAVTCQVLEKDPQNVAAHYIHGLLNGFHGKNLNSLTSLNYFEIMEKELSWVEKRDKNFDYGGIYRAWGRYYSQLPSLLGGDMNKAELFYRRAIELHPEYLLNNILLASLYQKQEKWEQARRALQPVLDSSEACAADLQPEWQMWKERANAIMARLAKQAPLPTGGENTAASAADSSAARADSQENKPTVQIVRRARVPLQ